MPKTLRLYNPPYIKCERKVIRKIRESTKVPKKYLIFGSKLIGIHKREEVKRLKIARFCNTPYMTGERKENGNK